MVCITFQILAYSKNLKPDQIHNTNMSELYWKGWSTGALMCDAENWAPGNKMCKHFTVMRCGNAFLNRKLKFVAIRKAKEPQSFKDTRANCTPAHFTTWKVQGWMEDTENWFHKYYFVTVLAFLKQIGLPQKAVVTRWCPVQVTVHWCLNNELIIVKFCPMSQQLSSLWTKK
jgi:hypothetical protein